MRAKLKELCCRRAKAEQPAARATKSRGEMNDGRKMKTISVFFANFGVLID
jgi:hypothetical protein